MIFFSIALTLFLLMDPVGNIPIFVTLLKHLSPKRQRRVIFREMLIALVTIVLFYYLGDLLLGLLHITHSTVMISGGIILFMIAIKLIFPSSDTMRKVSEHEREPFIVPLAIPLVAGPAVLATVMLFGHQTISVWIILGAVFIAWFASLIILLASSLLKKIMGDRGIAACERLMGLLLVLLAMQMFFDGIAHFLETNRA